MMRATARLQPDLGKLQSLEKAGFGISRQPKVATNTPNERREKGNNGPWDGDTGADGTRLIPTRSTAPTLARKKISSHHPVMRP